MPKYYVNFKMLIAPYNQYNINLKYQFIKLWVGNKVNPFWRRHLGI